ncbi:hypothetical protein FOZ63_018810 [Perkinsus olseni]|uniref:Uncharacterized protein n=1 Tax=Perkinsus olseni TaxID=32597 RepID=A0A7J6Q991_PEROL|nr:hypothetical protein FOZ63_018810 [Perkinsus olseni]
MLLSLCFFLTPICAYWSPWNSLVDLLSNQNNMYLPGLIAEDSAAAPVERLPIGDAVSLDLDWFDLIHHQKEMDLPGRYIADGSGETRECWSGKIAGPSDGALLGKGEDVLAELSLEGTGAETWGHTPLTGTVYSISMLWEADFHTAVTNYLVAQESASEAAARASALRIVRCASERMLCYLLKMAILVADAAVVEERSSVGNKTTMYGRLRRSLAAAQVLYHHGIERLDSSGWTACPVVDLLSALRSIILQAQDVFGSRLDRSLGEIVYPWRSPLSPLPLDLDNRSRVCSKWSTDLLPQQAVWLAELAHYGGEDAPWMKVIVARLMGDLGLSQRTFCSQYEPVPPNLEIQTLIDWEGPSDLIQDRMLSLMALSPSEGFSNPRAPHQFVPLRMLLRNQPKLSIVVSSRVDDFGVDSVKRLQVMLQMAAYGCHSSRILCEVLVIEWAPLPGRARLVDVLESSRLPSVVIRIVTVPYSLHRQFPGHRLWTFPDSVAANVGFGRATGEWILKLNTDSIVTPQVFGLLAVDTLLRPDTVYRATYIDAPVDVDQALEMPSDRFLETLVMSPEYEEAVDAGASDRSMRFGESRDFCKLRVPLNGSTAQRSPSDLYWLGSGDFILFHRAALEASSGYPNVLQHNLIDDTLHCRLLYKGINQVLLHPPCVNIHMHHRRDSDYLSSQ